MAIELVQFCMLGHWAGVAATQVEPVRSDADHSGAVAVESLVGLVPAQAPAAAQRVLLSVLTEGQENGVMVGVENTADLVRLPCSAVHPLPALLGARHQLKGLRALGWMDDARDDPLVLLFDWCTPAAPVG